jgi:hypothetical protein
LERLLPAPFFHVRNVIYVNHAEAEPLTTSGGWGSWRGVHARGTRTWCTHVVQAHNQGRLRSGELGGGRSGKNTKYKLEQVRGDKVGWFNGDPCHDPVSAHASFASVSDASARLPAPLGSSRPSLEQ